MVKFDSHWQTCSVPEHVFLHKQLHWVSAPEVMLPSNKHPAATQSLYNAVLSYLHRQCCSITSRNLTGVTDRNKYVYAKVPHVLSRTHNAYKCSWWWCRLDDALGLAKRHAGPSKDRPTGLHWPWWVQAQAAFLKGDLPLVCPLFCVSKPTFTQQPSLCVVMPTTPWSAGRVQNTHVHP